MNKALIVTYYWPPSGGVGVQRWLKLSKYLPEFGWEPVIFTPENPQFNIKDESLLAEVRQDIEVLRFPIWEPFGLFNKLSGNKKEVKQGLALEKADKTFADKAAVWVRGNLFIPDPRRFWVRPSIKFLSSFLPEAGINTLITTGPPHSMHLIGLGLKKKLPDLKWVADLRDPWSEWDMLDKLNAGAVAKRIHRHYEKKVLQNADRVLTVSHGMAKDFARLGAAGKTDVITNGYDAVDMPDFAARAEGHTFRITHLGLLNELRDPEPLFQALRALCEEDANFNDKLELELGGIISQSIIQRLESDPVLKDKIIWHEYLPRTEVVKKYHEASVLLLLQNRTEKSRHILPAKLFEYLPVGVPVLLLGLKRSDAADLLQETEAGRCVPFDDLGAIKSAVRELFASWKGSGPGSKKIHDNVKQYDRKVLAGKLADMLNELS